MKLILRTPTPILLLVLLGLSCRSTERSDTPRIVILVSVDTLRADHLGLYGYDRPTSPTIDALAEGGVIFEDVTSPSPWTLPAHGSMLTGLYPSRHGLKSHEQYLPSRLPTLGSILSSNGWATAAVVNSHNLGPNFGLDRGFQQYRYVEETADRIEPTTPVTEQAMAWLGESRPQPFFLFIHYYDVHTDYRSLPEYEKTFAEPYEGIADGTTAQLAAFRGGKITLDENDARHLINLYDAGIRQMDDELGRLLTFLEKEGLWKETLLVLTSDHGEEFGEHGDYLHGRSQFQEVVRVPLLFAGPSVTGPRKIQTPVSLVDLVPTLLDLVGIEIPGGLDGVSLLSSIEEGESIGERFLFGEADHNNVEHDMTRAVRRRDLKLHYNRVTRAHQLFDLGEDPQEHRDVSGERDGVAQEMLAELRRFMEVEGAKAPRRVLSPEEIEKLRSLGYIQ